MAYFGEMQSTAGNIFSAYASVAASVMLFRSMATDMVPEPVKSFFISFFSHVFKHLFGRFWTRISSEMTIVIDDVSGITRNHIYDAAEIYLRTKINPTVERLKVNKSHKQKHIHLSMEKEQEVIDCFKDDIQLKWQFVLIEPNKENSAYQSEKRYFELTFDKQYKDTVVTEYLPYVISKSKEIKDNERAVKLYTRDCSSYDNDDDEGGNGTWGCINFDHPVTFDKLAMDPKLKKEVVDDLDRFLRRRDYYKKVGKAWKRGYLLYGPPGTGKSSLIAAMANYLRFGVYDLELTSLYSNSELRSILLCTNPRSIIVIEDIDCSAQMLDREAEPNSDDNQNSKLTLSGFLNFIDGLWSACGDERIIIFTTNHKEKLDPALLRPGRMDMHIHMGYCTPEGFDVLAFNYLGINDHPRLFPEIKGLIKEVEITPAEIAERLMRNEDVDLALEGVLELLKEKKKEQSEVPENGSDEKEKKSDVVQSEEKEKKNKFGKFGKSLRKFRKGSSRGKKKEMH